ncbi:hypothetical protein [uncultured Slackia sp.]|uniref:hypothetical protein n=1 Tax=uncultured Slackia sp. TaxID=665903 RepID=UPI0025FF742C|nr:hypothetical protein [uncultured Slackia sp.]
MSNATNTSDIREVLSAASLPIDPNSMDDAAKLVADYYENAPEDIRIPIEEIPDRFSEMWGFWLENSDRPSKELKDVVRVAVGVDHGMKELANNYFKLEEKLEKKQFMKKGHAIALIGCAPLIRTLVVEQHLGLDRIRAILNVPTTTIDAINAVISSIGINPPFSSERIVAIHEADVADVAALFGDTEPGDAGDTFRGLLGSFSRCDVLADDIIELGLIPFEPYQFMLYFELLTLEMVDRFPGRAIYECAPRSNNVKALWNSMYHPTQENPYLNNAKSVYSLDEAWAETKLSRQTGNGSIVLADAFDILAELPYTTRRRVAHVIRCYLILIADSRQVKTPLEAIGCDSIKAFIECVGAANSLTKGVLDQRLVDFLTRCIHPEEGWFARGLGSSVNETNASGRKYGDVEYLELSNRSHIEAYEAHGGSLRDEYIQAHINSLHETVLYRKHQAKLRNEPYDATVGVTYVAHDISRLVNFHDGYAEEIEGVPFEFRFMTYFDLLDVAGGINAVAADLPGFDKLIHQRISRLPDAYTLKRRYQEITGLRYAE